jgi:hypothetical protein
MISFRYEVMDEDKSEKDARYIRKGGNIIVPY